MTANNSSIPLHILAKEKKEAQFMFSVYNFFIAESEKVASVLPTLTSVLFFFCV